MAEPTDPDEGGNPAESSVIKELRAKAKRADDAEARAEAAERRLAFSEAGLSGLSEKQAKALLAAHDGEVTADALKSTADELGFGAREKVETPEPEVTGTEAEVSELARLAASPASSHEPPPAAAAEFDKQVNEFTGSYQDFETMVLRNAHLIPGAEGHGK